MPEATLDQVAIKTSKNPIVQDKVEKKREELEGIDPSLANKVARRDVAKEIRIVRLRESLKKAEERSLFDGLTGLYNRDAFDRRIKEEAERLTRTGSKAVIVFMDANELKEVNDIQGHPEGDRLLKKIAKILIKGSRKIDVIARCGGDEFNVILTDTTLENADLWWRRVNGEFESQEISIAAGATELMPHDIDTSILLADEAMYETKQEFRRQRRENNNGNFIPNTLRIKTVVK